MITTVGTRSRIAPVDGLRALAVLGVVWYHVWQGFGNVSWLIGIGHHHLSLNEPLSIGQTGVDLFFVISGFCMYLMYARKQTSFTWNAYSTFLRARFLRIAPAYYAAIGFFSVGFLIVDGRVPLRNLVANALWLPQFTHAPTDFPTPFWSLSVEWGFYLLLPALVWGAFRFGFVRTIVVIAVCSFLFRCACFVLFSASSHGVLDWNWATLPPTCLIEFVPGIIVAWCYSNKMPIPRPLAGWFGIGLAVAVTIIGRVLIWHSFTHSVGMVAGIIGLPLMSVGYGMLLWNVVASATALQRGLCWRPMQAIGRWSYSIYLFHMAAIPLICRAMIQTFGRNPASQHIAFALVLCIVIPCSGLSYLLFERPYFLLHSRFRESATSIAVPSVIGGDETVAEAQA